MKLHTKRIVEVKGKEKHLHRILLNGESVVNLIPNMIATELGLTFCQSKDRMLTICTATGTTLQIRYYARFDITIAGVTANIRAYINPCMTTYTLLLGRSWMKQVRASGNFEEGTYHIEVIDGRLGEILVCNTGRTIRLEGKDAHVQAVEQKCDSEEENDQSWLSKTTNRALGRVIDQIEDGESSEDESTEYDKESEEEVEEECEYGDKDPPFDMKYRGRYKR